MGSSGVLWSNYTIMSYTFFFMQEKHRANPKITRRRKQRKNIKENQATN